VLWLLAGALGLTAVCTSDGTASILLADDGRGGTYPYQVGAVAIRTVRLNIC
jgi:hypothetical protein